MAAALCLGACWSAPVGDPATPEPVATSATPFEDDRLEFLAERCGSQDPAPSTAAFVGETSWPSGSLPSGMTVPVNVTVQLESNHGEHTVDLAWTTGYVTDAGGDTVHGLVTGIALPPGGAASGTSPAFSAPIVVSLGLCPPPGDGAELGSPLPDGDYELVLSGPVTAHDHDHAEQEYWVAQPLPFSVADGDLTLGTS